MKTKEILKKIGGYRVVGKLLNVSDQCVYNWAKADKIPDAQKALLIQRIGDASRENVEFLEGLYK